MKITKRQRINESGLDYNRKYDRAYEQLYNYLEKWYQRNNPLIGWELCDEIVESLREEMQEWE